jgi:hypothetical protein
LAIQILADERASMTSVDYAIGIQHGNELKDEARSKINSHRTAACQEVNDALDDE